MVLPHIDVVRSTNKIVLIGNNYGNYYPFVP